MTRSILSLRMLTVTGVVVLVACGPRLKPVEYEEPKNSGSGAPDDSETASGHKSKSSSVAGDTTSGSSSGESSSSTKGPYKSCDEKAKNCGTACTECAPGNADCMEVLIQKQCNPGHKCVAAPVDCTVAEKSDKKDSKKK